MFYDCVAEIKGLCKVIKEMEPITREEFERQEFEHFKTRLVNRLQYPPEIETLRALGMEVQISGNEIKALPNPEFIEEVMEKVEEVSEEIRKLPPVMENMIAALKEVVLKGLPEGSEVLGLPQSEEGNEKEE